MRDILLHIASYPVATSHRAIEEAVRFTAAMGGVLSAVATEIDLGGLGARLTDHLIGLAKLAEVEEGESRQACRSGLDAFTTQATASGVLGDQLRVRSPLSETGKRVAEQARTRDLCIVPFTEALDGQRAVAEAVVFGSGRPVIHFQPGTRGLLRQGLSTVVLAWDGSRAASRAMGDALPIMRKAREVRVTTVLREKSQAPSASGAEAARYLQVHGVNAIVDEVDARGRRVGQALEDHAAERGTDLLVMGAYGHSRLKDFILGGATEYMLFEPKVPLFLSQ